MTSVHALERIRSRVTDDNVSQRILARANRAASTLSRSQSHAVLLWRDGTHQGDTHANYHSRMTSNGTLCVAIIRHGTLVTVMWRREDQPWSPDAMSVDNVWHYGKAS
jgi:hypothetical protein